MSDHQGGSLAALEQEKARLQAELEALRAGAAVEADTSRPSIGKLTFVRCRTLAAAKLAAIRLAERQLCTEAEGSAAFHVSEAGTQAASNPDDANLWNSKGEALSEAGRLEEALAAYETALEIDPKRILSWQCLGCVREDLGRFEIALEAYEQLLELDPDDELGLCQQGEVLQRLGRYEGSLSACERLLSIYPEHPIALYNRGGH
jgi:tetratricopeptide (TPR) repeat protein